MEGEVYVKYTNDLFYSRNRIKSKLNILELLNWTLNQEEKGQKLEKKKKDHNESSSKVNLCQSVWSAMWWTES